MFYFNKASTNNNPKTIMKSKVAVVMGGYSSEYEISLKSGNFICQELDQSKFDIYRAHIFKNDWYVMGEQGKKYPIDKSDFSIRMDGQKINFDCVFNMIHGNPGENGLLQGYLETIEIPQTASNFYASALTFNKRDCISVLKDYGILAAENYFLHKGDPIDEDAILKKVGLPCFVKANRSGSSFGISKVKTKAALKPAIQHSFDEDDEVIIESFLEGTEVDVGVIQYQGKTQALPVTEIVSENEFFDYEAKYLGKSQEITPARITPEQTREVQELSIRIFNLLRLNGFARAEFIYHKGKPHFLEINTCPGMSPASIVPKQLQAAGIAYMDFFTDLVYRTLQNS